MDGDGGGAAARGVEPLVSGVHCSICLDLVSDSGGRSRAKLQCGHEFHLDCIGSAFNSKGEMQCPNCRNVEKGQWLYANDFTCLIPEFSMDDWNPDEDPYDPSYSEMAQSQNSRHTTFLQEYIDRAIERALEAERPVREAEREADRAEREAEWAERDAKWAEYEAKMEARFSHLESMIRQSMSVPVVTQHIAVPNRDSTPLLNVRSSVGSGSG